MKGKIIFGMFFVFILMSFVSAKSYSGLGTHFLEIGDTFKNNNLEIVNFTLYESNTFGRVITFDLTSGGSYIVKEDERAWLTDDLHEGYKIRISVLDIDTKKGIAEIKFEDANSEEVLNECENAGYACMDISCAPDMEVTEKYDCGPPIGRPTPCCRFKLDSVPDNNKNYLDIRGLSEVNSKYFTLSKIDPYGDTRWEFKPDAETFTTNLQRYITEEIEEFYINGEKVSYIPRYDLNVEKIDVIIIKVDSSKLTIDNFLNYINGDELRNNYLGVCSETPEKLLFTEVKQINGVSNAWDGQRAHYKFYLDNSNCPYIKSHEFTFWMSNDKLIWTDTVFEGKIPELNGEFYYVGYLFTDRYSNEYPSTLFPLLEKTCMEEGKRKQGNYCSNKGTHYVPQKRVGYSCHKDYECYSNFCSQLKCSNPGFFRGIVIWFKNLFG